MSDSNVSRRDFIRNAAILTGAGLAIGGAAAAGKAVWDASQAGPNVAETQALQSQVADSAARIAQLQQSLTTAEVELAQLRPDYAAALSKNAELLNTLSAKQQEADTAKNDLLTAQAKIDKLMQLMAMYDKLDNNAFDTLLQNGLTTAAGSVAGTLGLLPLVSEGVKLARSLLDNFEFQIPNFRGGLSWLQKRMDEMTASINTVEKAIRQALKTLDPVTNTMTQLVKYILAYLPSQIGAGVKGALDAVNLLYQSLPPVIVGAHDQVIAMLTEPFADNEKGLIRTLVKPIRDQSLTPSEALAAQVKSLNLTFTQSLHDPVKQALEQRASVLKEIAEFRVGNNL